MLLLEGLWASPKMQSGNHAKRVNSLSLLENGGNFFVSGYFLHMPVICKSLRRVIQSLGSAFECLRMSLPQAFAICSL